MSPNFPHQPPSNRLSQPRRGANTSTFLWVAALALGGGLCGAGVASAENGYYRFPALSGDTVVFTAEGDLWTVSASGGSARRLTSHAAEETHAAVSPDGRQLAFAASYDSAVEAYVMPLAGGAPRRLTFDGGGLRVIGWTPQGEVLYASQNLSGPASRRVLRAVDPQTLTTRTLPLHEAHEASIDPTTGTIYFTRFGLQVTGDNAKRYRGGALAELWRFTPGSDPKPANEAVELAPEAGSAQHRPMWWNGRLYHLSDADGTHNLWSMRGDGSDRQQHTRHQGFDVRNPSLDAGRVVYQLGADLHLLDLASGEDRQLAIDLISDFEQRRVRHHKAPLDFLTNVSLAPAGDALLITARGRLAKVAPGPIRRVEIAVPPAHRARNGVASVDGRKVYAISDQSGEPEIWQYAADGSTAAKQLTHDGVVHRWRLFPSPDGRWLAHDDKRGRLFLLDLEGGKNEQIDAGPRVGDDPYADVVWSPDSKTLALVRPDSNQLRNQVLLYSLASRRLEPLTSDRYESFAPAFSPNGEWLYFISNRTFTATLGHPWGDRNLGPLFDRRGKVYAIALQTGLRFPFQPVDELAPKEPAKAESTKEDPNKDSKSADKSADKSPAGKSPAAKTDDKTDKPLPAIVWEGLRDRLFEVPLAAGNYVALAVDADRLYLLDAPTGPDAKPNLLTLAIKNDAPKPETFASAVREMALSKDRKKLYYRTHDDNGPGTMYIVDAGAKAPTELAKSTVRVGDWVLPVAPSEEWRQMFVDAWRLARDFAFDPKLRGVDWVGVRGRYEPLVERLTARSELDDLLAQMAAELGILHSQIRPGELRKDDEVANTAGLGAELERRANGVSIAHIYRTEAELPGERGPLAQPGVDVREGDLITAVNGRPLSDGTDIAELLHNTAGQQVLLDLDRGGKGHRVVVVPVNAGREVALRISDWEQSRRAVVDEVGGGKIGYLHLRAMGGNDLSSFVRELYANIDRDGLIIDVRRNRGGNIDSILIEKLLRRAWGYWHSADAPPGWNMQQSFRGHLVVLIDQLTYSDGETFAAAVKALGLGPLVGMRTAGAGIWLSDRTALADRGMARVAEYAQFSADGRWLIEGRGVSPDIEVDNLPHASFNGDDRQLEVALDVLTKKLASDPVARPESGPIAPVGQPAEDIK